MIKDFMALTNPNKKKAFTLIELIVVIVIIGILATLAFSQYTTFTEKARAAEARANLGAIRTFASAYFLEQGSFYSTTRNINNGDVGVVNPPAAGLPATCSPGYYFSYAVVDWQSPDLGIVATRCTGGSGKPPDGPSGYHILAYISGSDGSTVVFGPLCYSADWTSNCGY
jgi:prepilin-type N-terminal cleavage/methylation domain-containing protein